ncbi:MAG: beta-ketoacyl-[acyl-carrier-protein] synthase II, partial [Gemmatirosa sp.]
GISALAVHEQIVPPTINHERTDPEIELDVTPNTPRRREIRAAISNSSGFDGHNATLAIRQLES